MLDCDKRSLNASHWCISTMDLKYTYIYLGSVIIPRKTSHDSGSIKSSSVTVSQTTRCWSFNSFPNKPRFLRVCSTSLLKTLWEKEKLLVKEPFLLFPQCFLLVLRTFCNFNQVWNCRLQTLSVWKSLTFVVWERVNYNMDHWQNISTKTHLNILCWLTSVDTIFTQSKPPFSYSLTRLSHVLWKKGHNSVLINKLLDWTWPNSKTFRWQI